MLFGFWKLVVVAASAAYLLRRSGLWRHPLVRALRAAPPGPEAPRGTKAPARRWDDRLYWFLLVLAATAVAAWVATRVLIHAAPGPPTR